MSFSENLKYYRKRAKISRKTIAQILNIHPNAYGMYETGAREPNIEKLCKIAKTLHVTTDELLDFLLDEYTCAKDYLKLRGIKAEESPNGSIIVTYKDMYDYQHESDGKIKRIQRVHKISFESKEQFLDIYRKVRKDVGFNFDEIFKISFGRRIFEHKLNENSHVENNTNVRSTDDK